MDLNMSVFSLEEEDYGDTFITQNCSQPENACEILESSQDPFEGIRFKSTQPLYEGISDDDDFEIPLSQVSPATR